MTHEPEESFLRRHRTAIIVAVVAVVSAIVLNQVFSNRENAVELDELIALLPKSNGNRRPVLDVVTGISYLSESDASRQTGIPQSSISHNVIGNRPFAQGHAFKDAIPV